MSSLQDEDNSQIDNLRKCQQFIWNATANGISVSLLPGLNSEANIVNTGYKSVPKADLKSFINRSQDSISGAREIQYRGQPKYLQTKATSGTSIVDLMSDPVNGEYFRGWLQYPTENARAQKKTNKDFPRPTKTNPYKHKIGYLSLPGEIRHKIMWFALFPGELFPSHKTQPVNLRGSRAFMPGCQLLATCRQAYLEGCESFYSFNTFHLPRGRLSTSIKYFASLKSEHQCLISRFCIDFSILDLTPSVMARIEQAYFENELDPWRVPLQSRAYDVVTPYVLYALRDLWVEKIIAVGKTLGIQRVELRGVPIALHDPGSGTHRTYNIATKALIMEGPGIARLLKPLDLVMSCKGWDSMYLLHDSQCRWDEKIHWLLDDMLSSIEFIVKAKLIKHEVNGRGGWEYFKEWLRNLENSPAEDCTYLQVGEELWNEKKGWHTGHRSQLAISFAK